MKKYLFPLIIALSALSVSASAAFYSIMGLSKLFAGAALAVIIMASCLEVAKLVTASLVYQYRKTLPKLLKFYFITAVIILILITSMGIYGFLSHAYETTSASLKITDNQIELFETQKNNYIDQLEIYNNERISISEDINNLRSGLSSNITQYIDRETGQLITTTSAANRRSLENQLDQAIKRQSNINDNINEINEKIFELDENIVEVRSQVLASSELGPLRYIANLTGVAMDRVVNWLMLVIIFVFDPLAISLVIAANFAFNKAREKKPKIETKDNREKIILPTLPQEEKKIEEPKKEEGKSIKNQNIIDRIMGSPLSTWRKKKELKNLNEDFQINY